MSKHPIIKNTVLTIVGLIIVAGLLFISCQRFDEQNTSVKHTSVPTITRTQFSKFYDHKQIASVDLEPKNKHIIKIQGLLKKHAYPHHNRNFQATVTKYQLNH